jgi:hypothetical protein
MIRLRDLDLVHKLPWWAELGIVGLIVAVVLVITSPTSSWGF